MDCEKFLFSGHALQRMFERRIPQDEVERIAREGEIVEAYPQDIPYSSQLILGFVGDRPIHVVAGYEEAEKRCIISDSV